MVRTGYPASRAASSIAARPRAPTSTADGKRTPVRSSRWYGLGHVARAEGIGASPWDRSVSSPGIGDAADDVGEECVAFVAEADLPGEVDQGLQRVVESFAPRVVAFPGLGREIRHGGDVEGFHLAAGALVDVFAGVAGLAVKPGVRALAADRHDVPAADHGRRRLRVVALAPAAVLPGVVPLAVQNAPTGKGPDLLDPLVVHRSGVGRVCGRFRVWLGVRFGHGCASRAARLTSSARAAS